MSSGAEILFELKEFKKALRDLKRAVSILHSNYELYYFIAICKICLDRHKEALGDLELVIKKSSVRETIRIYSMFTRIQLLAMKENISHQSLKSVLREFRALIRGKSQYLDVYNSTN